MKKLIDSQYLIITEGKEKEDIEKALSSLIVGCEVSFTHIPYKEMSVGDCTREIRKTNGGTLQKYQGMHGSSGQWENVSLVGAVEWLYEAAMNNIKVTGSHDCCYYIIKTVNRVAEGF